MPTYTFFCGCGWRGDRRVSRGVERFDCPDCGVPAAKEAVYRVAFAGFTGTPLDQRTYWQEFKDFKEASAELEYRHGRAEESAGEVLPTPPLAQIAKRRAQELMKLGVKSSEDLKSRERH